MRTLVIDSATEVCSVALVDGAKVIAADTRVLGRGHAEHLVPMIAALPERGRAARIAVATGPGSFTGVRVGIAAARALAFAWGSDLCGYSTLALVAAMAGEQVAPRARWVVMTAGHGEWFVQHFDAGAGPLGPSRSLVPAQAMIAIGGDPVAGSAAPALAGLRGHGEAVALLPDARAFALLAPDRLTTAPRPDYGRVPDALPPIPAKLGAERSA